MIPSATTSRVQVTEAEDAFAICHEEALIGRKLPAWPTRPNESETGFRQTSAGVKRKLSRVAAI
jgi:hypothetical protein